MKILVLNCGSSSLKYQLIDMNNEEVLAKGNYERIGELEAFVTHKVNGEKYVIQKGVENHEQALNIIIEQLLHTDYGVICSLSEIDAVGHRVVHGGEIFNKSVLIDDDVIAKIEECSVLAPLHNPAAIIGINACRKIMPGVKMSAVFDTAFHQTMPKTSFLYPIPYEYYEKYGVRKYGMHGTSHNYVSKRMAEILDIDVNELNIITCHLGQGSSLCAIKNGKSIDTSMGLTPLGGIPMVTRSGDLDPSVVTYIMEKENISASEMNNILNKKSGLAAVSKLSPDYREIENASFENEDAFVANQIFVSQIAQYIARYASILGEVDNIVFTGGIGENQINTRKAICDRLKFMGVEINDDANSIKGEEVEISTPNSKVKVWIVPTNEELMIAKDTLELCK
ncbi:MAG: acetate kinase [Clostridiales bacterium]|nr:acetate kinase [Clostridiales bacterium]